ncbi:hypothetical protein ABD76_19390 [Paenibacillus dendritiformis]|nr:hypothetical protein [Paenibacillus dendritiformis]
MFDDDFCNVNWVVNLKKLMFRPQHRLTQARIPMKQAKSPQKQLIKSYCRQIIILYIVNIDKL